MKTCCVCGNPSFDDSPKSPLCETCARILSEFESSEADKLASRILAEFMERMERDGLGGKVTEILEGCDQLTEKQVEEIRPEDAFRASQMTRGELNHALAVLLALVRNVGVPA